MFDVVLAPAGYVHAPPVTAVHADPVPDHDPPLNDSTRVPEMMISLALVVVKLFPLTVAALTFPADQEVSSVEALRNSMELTVEYAPVALEKPAVIILLVVPAMPVAYQDARQLTPVSLSMPIVDTTAVGATVHPEPALKLGAELQPAPTFETTMLVTGPLIVNALVVIVGSVLHPPPLAVQTGPDVQLDPPLVNATAITYPLLLLGGTGLNVSTPVSLTDAL